ncbi:CobW family GTP-binding protein [Chachezhania sediminis]|uniref:CobW family GTP-binding protein n=1 Tax=Chachezhania sediminis TaxID=2599291 RepID=UPI00131DE646|nr:GTP-binding protein [Chachezhania sediminis]
MARPALPVTVIGGYLGAGKTTLVNQLLRHSGLRLAVMVNEFGALPIDRDLIEAEDDALISISGGCVCCEFGDDLAGALLQVAGMDPRPDHILLESSGVAIPGSILTTLLFLDGLRGDGVVVVADAAEIRNTAANTYLADTIQRQLDDADILVLNKTDLVSEAELAEVTGWVRSHTKGTRIVPAVHGAVPHDVLLGSVPLPRRGHKVSGHAEALFRSRVLQPDGPVDPVALARALAEGDLGLVRAKGYVARPGGGLSLIQVVGARWTVEDATDDHQTGVVCIGLKATFDADGLARLGPLEPVPA